jgi:hypothetical protein
VRSVSYSKATYDVVMRLLGRDNPTSLSRVFPYGAQSRRSPSVDVMLNATGSGSLPATVISQQVHPAASSAPFAPDQSHYTRTSSVLMIPLAAIPTVTAAVPYGSAVYPSTVRPNE